MATPALYHGFPICKSINEGEKRLPAGCGEAGRIRKKPASTARPNTVVMQRLADAHLMVIRPRGPGLEAPEATSADKLRPGAVNPQFHAHKAI